ncbi:MAG: hypothetical protein ACRDJC_26735, partial [Thermomicrobiales bacterium]
FCKEVGAGEQWTVGQPWFMAQDFEAVPEEFVPTGETPLEDFIAKFTAVKYVIDPGSKQEKTVVFPKDDTLFVDDDFAGLVYVSPITLGLLKPLSVGEHVVEVYWVLSALHCDGIDDEIDVNCLPAGEILFSRVTFEVTPGHH